jgi:hypothetical protein
MNDTPPKPPKPARGSKASRATPIIRSARNERQAEYQRAYRADQRSKRIPSRDDAARVALHWAIMQMIGNGDEDGISRMHRGIVRQLVELGFDPNGADRRVSDLIDRYEDGWTFQAKPHLRANPEGDKQS